MLAAYLASIRSISPAIEPICLSLPMTLRDHKGAVQPERHKQTQSYMWLFSDTQEVAEFPMSDEELECCVPDSNCLNRKWILKVLRLMCVAEGALDLEVKTTTYHNDYRPKFSRLHNLKQSLIKELLFTDISP